MHTDSAQELEATDPAFSDVSREYLQSVADIEDPTQSTTSLTGAVLARAKTKLHARVAAAKESVQKLGGKLSDHTTDAVTSADGYVHEQPWKAICIAAGVSLVVGYLLGRRE